jgi:methylmalonyl-CoA mutase N-terminal domain/subunit
MYRDKLWTMRQYAGFSTAEESNKRYHYLLNHGTTVCRSLLICLLK